MSLTYFNVRQPDAAGCSIDAITTVEVAVPAAHHPHQSPTTLGAGPPATVTGKAAAVANATAGTPSKASTIKSMTCWHPGNQLGTVALALLRPGWGAAVVMLAA
jgi:hypothetical protein